MGGPWARHFSLVGTSLWLVLLAAWQRASRRSLWSEPLSSSFSPSRDVGPASCSGHFPLLPVIFHRHHLQFLSYASSFFLVCFLEDLTSTQLQPVSLGRTSLRSPGHSVSRPPGPWQYLLLGFLPRLARAQLALCLGFISQMSVCAPGGSDQVLLIWDPAGPEYEAPGRLAMNLFSCKYMQPLGTGSCVLEAVERAP